MKKDPFLLFLGILPIILSLLISVTILLMGQFLPSKLPLFYSLPWGEDQLATLWQFLIIPSVLICISLINLMIYWQLHQSQKLLKEILVVTTLICSLILFITFIKIILIFI